jgi:hypothetical protein
MLEACIVEDAHERCAPIPLLLLLLEALRRRRRRARGRKLAPAATRRSVPSCLGGYYAVRAGRERSR